MDLLPARLPLRRGARQTAARLPRGAVVNQPQEPPDHRFTLANERTLLAWIRTALALDVSGLGVLRFAPQVGPEGGREVIGIALILLGAVSAAVGYSRWASMDRTLRTGSPLPPATVLKLLAYSLAALSLASAVLIVGRALLG
jgi:putative membrane protein